MQACREACTRQHVLYKVYAVAGCITTDVEPQQPHAYHYSKQINSTRASQRDMEGRWAGAVNVCDSGVEKKRKDKAFRRQFNQKPSIIPGCPGTVG